MRENLLSTRVVTYRVKPSEADMELLRRHEALQAIEEPTDAESEELAKLSAERVIVDEYRCTLSAYSIMQKARHDANRNKAFSWIGDAMGVPFVESTEDNQSPDGVGRDKLFGMALAWAAILPAITGIEGRQIDMLSDYKTEWTQEPIPTAWVGVETFLTSLEEDLANELASKTYELNPRLIRGIPQDEISKKFGVVSVA